MLTNPRSDRVKAVRALSRRSVRSRTGEFLAEGPQAVREAVAFRPELVREAHDELVRLADAGAISPVAGGVVEFSDAPSAIQELAGGQTVGRLVVRVAGSADAAARASAGAESSATATATAGAA